MRIAIFLLSNDQSLRTFPRTTRTGTPPVGMCLVRSVLMTAILVLVFRRISVIVLWGIKATSRRRTGGVAAGWRKGATAKEKELSICLGVDVTRIAVLIATNATAKTLNQKVKVNTFLIG